ncbi:ATP-binding cassette domain-containing protein [Glutamicibacter halophytocola]|uniref:ATP-binding cassette domain-containing protein n=1 Tax=Glutamicibacter halophytocola TaxID=1933880 RepID=UPI00321C1963
MTHPLDQRQPALENPEHGPDYIVSLRSLSVSFGERDVLVDCDLSISGKERLAVLGDNGSGKSTLMRVIAGNLEVERGQRHINAPGGVAYAAQNPRFAASMSIQQVIDSYHARFRELENLMRIISLKLQGAQGPALLNA